MSILFNTNPVVVFAIAMVSSVFIFFAVRLLLFFLYEAAYSRFKLFHQYVETVRKKGFPLFAKYGLIGLVAFVAIPFPGTGVYGATILSWLLGINWQTSLLVIVPGAAVSNGLIVLSMIGIVRGINPTL